MSIVKRFVPETIDQSEIQVHKNLVTKNDLHLEYLLEHPDTVTTVEFTNARYEREDGQYKKGRPSITINYFDKISQPNATGTMTLISSHYGCIKFYMPQDGVTMSGLPCIRTKWHGAEANTIHWNTYGTDMLNKLLTIVEDTLQLRIEDYTDGHFQYWQ